MALPTWYSTGTVSVESGSTTVIATGALWGTGEDDDNIMVGDLFSVPSQPLIPAIPIASITEDGEVELLWPWPGDDVDDQPYIIRYVGIIERSTRANRMALERMADISAWADIMVEDDDARLALETEGNPLRKGYRVLVKEDGVIWAKASSAYEDWIGPVEFKGDKGDKGWTPQIVAEVDGERRVFKLSGYTGGEGTAPTANVGQYLKADGTWTSTKSAAADFRGESIISKGDYDSGTAYVKGDYVQRFGSSWVLTAATSTGNAPPTLPTTSNTWWQLLARQGIDGAGTVNSIVAGDGIEVDNTDPTNPVITSTATGGNYVSAADFGMLPSATAAENKTALLAAMDAALTVFIPAGTYAINGDIEVRRSNQTIMGEGSAEAYNYSYGPTRLVFASGTVGFDLQTYFNYTPAVDYASGMNSEYGSLRNLDLDGDGNVGTMIKFKGTKFFSGLNITNFIYGGIRGEDWLNSSRIEQVSIFNYNSRGAAWGDASKFVGTGIDLRGTNSTCTFVNRVRVRCCAYGMGLIGIQGSSFRDCIIESNSNVGMAIDATDNHGTVRNVFENLWFENNAEYAADASMYQLSIRNYATSSTWYARNNRFVNCNFSTPNTSHQKAILVGANVVGTKFENCSFGPNSAGDSVVVSAAPGHGTEFINCIGVDHGLASWGNFSVPTLGGARLKKATTGATALSMGETSPNITMANGTTLTIHTDGGGATLGAMLMLHNPNSGGIALFMVSAGGATQIVDTASLFTPGDGSTSGQFNVWSDPDGKIYIENNVGSSRLLTVSVLGARINSMSGPA